MRKRSTVVSFRIGDLVKSKRSLAGVEIGVVIGIARFQIMYRVHGLKVLWNDGGLEVEHPSDLKMVGRVACKEPTLVIKSNHE
jgi:hypothetical protein